MLAIYSKPALREPTSISRISSHFGAPVSNSGPDRSAAQGTRNIPRAGGVTARAAGTSTWGSQSNGIR